MVSLNLVDEETLLGLTRVYKSKVFELDDSRQYGRRHT